MNTSAIKEHVTTKACYEWVKKTNVICVRGLSGKYPAILNISRTDRVTLM